MRSLALQHRSAHATHRQLASFAAVFRTASLERSLRENSCPEAGTLAVEHGLTRARSVGRPSLILQRCHSSVAASLCECSRLLCLVVRYVRISAPSARPLALEVFTGRASRGAHTTVTSDSSGMGRVKPFAPHWATSLPGARTLSRHEIYIPLLLFLSCICLCAVWFER